MSASQACITSREFQSLDWGPACGRTEHELLIAKAGNVERTRRRLPARIKGMHLHLGRVVTQADRNQTRRDLFFHGTADSRGKISFGRSLQWNLPGDNVFVNAVKFALIDHISARDCAICS